MHSGDHLRAFVEQVQRRCQADPPAGTGNDDGLSSQQLAHGDAPHFVCPPTVSGPAKIVVLSTFSQSSVTGNGSTVKRAVID